MAKPAKRIIPYVQMKDEICVKSTTKPKTGHNIWLSFTADGYPAFCAKCGTASNDPPQELFEDM